jgi:hypothetical protein
MMVRGTGLTAHAVSISFPFLFISTMTLVTTSKLNEQPALAGGLLRQWVLICIFVVLTSALVFSIT